MSNNHNSFFYEEFRIISEDKEISTFMVKPIQSNHIIPLLQYVSGNSFFFVSFDATGAC